MQFRYKYVDLDCRLCGEKVRGDCEHLFCPHIMENLDDLHRDPDFTEAVQNAESCVTSHKATLMLLKSRGFKGRKRAPDNEPEYISEPELYSFKRICSGCHFPRHGFFCHFCDGSCLKTELRRFMRKRRFPCPA